MDLNVTISQVNIDHHIREKIKRSLVKPDLTCFDEAEMHIYRLMEEDSCPRFLKSEAFQNLRNAARNPVLTSQWQLIHWKMFLNEPARRKRTYARGLEEMTEENRKYVVCRGSASLVWVIRWMWKIKVSPLQAMIKNEGTLNCFHCYVDFC